AVLGAGEGQQGQAAAGAVFLAFGEVEGLLDDGQVGVVAAFGAGLSGLLAARPLGGGRGGGPGGGLVGAPAGLAFLAEGLLLAMREPCLELGDFLLELGLTCDSQLVQAFPVASLAERLVAFLEVGADRTGPLRQRAGPGGASGDAGQGDTLPNV